MRGAFIVGGALLLFATACAGGQKAAKRAELSEILVPSAAKPDAPRAEDRAPPPAVVAAPVQLVSAAKTEEGRVAARQERNDAAQRERGDRKELGDLVAVREESGGFVITFPDSTLFAPGEVVLLPSSNALMEHVARALLADKDRDMVVAGHTDSSGDESRGIEMTRQRAEAVRAYLIAKGYPAERIRAQGIGRDRPVSTNGSFKGRAQNRRMEIAVGF